MHSQQEQEQEQEEQQQLPVVVTFQTYLKMSIRQHINVSNGDITDWLIPRHTCPTFGHNHTNMKLSNALQSTIHPPTFQPVKRQSIQNIFVGLLFSVQSAINNWIFKKKKPKKKPKKHTQSSYQELIVQYMGWKIVWTAGKSVWPFSCVDPDV